MKLENNSRPELHEEITFLKQRVVELETLLANQETTPNSHKETQVQGPLSQEHVRLRTLINNLPDYIYVKDLNSRFLANNSAHAQALGETTPDNVIGKTDFDFFPPEMAQKFYADEQKILQTGVAALNKEEEALVYQSGKRIRKWMSSTKVPFYDSHGDPIGIVGVSHDITEQKKLEQQIQESWDRRGRQVKISTEIAQRITTAPALDDLYHLVVNLIQEQFGYYHVHIYTLSEEDTLLMQEGTGEAGNTMKEIGHHIALDAKKSLVAQAARRGQPVMVSDVTQVGRWLPNPLLPETKSEIAVPIKFGQEVLGVLDIQNNTVDSLTEEDQILLTGLCGQIAIAVYNHHLQIKRQESEKMRTALEEQLRQSQKMEAIGRLAGGVAHDFNNLLTAILGYSNLALKQLSPGQDIYNDIKEIKKTAQRAADLTHQLLAFAHRQVIEPRVINLNNLILGLDKLLRRLIDANIELVVLPETELGEVRIDPGKIEQVLVNLVVNACDAMPDGGKLFIKTANITLDEKYVRRHPQFVSGQYVLLTVTDTGSGMSDEVKKHIFEPFFTTKEPGKGTGLGLATCFGIIKQSKGQITVQSAPDRGTTFEIYLPRIGEAILAKSETDVGTKLPLGTETILLAEDEAVVQDLTARVLRSQGYTVLVASNGDEALRLANEQPKNEIDLLLTDIVMPQLGGRELANQLRVQYPNIKVLYTSGYTDDEALYYPSGESDTAFLQKPYTDDDLARRVREILDV